MSAPPWRSAGLACQHSDPVAPLHGATEATYRAKPNDATK